MPKINVGTVGDVLGNSGKLMEREILGEAGWKINHLEYETFANKNVIHENRERAGPFNINDVKRALHRQQCFEEYNAEIRNQYRKFYANIGVCI